MIRSAYDAKNIPVRLWAPETGFEPETPADAVAGSSPATPAEDVIEAAVEALFPRARSHGINKQALREAIRQPGQDAVAAELGAGAT